MYYLSLGLFFVSFALVAYTLAAIVRPHRSALTEQIGFYEKSWRTAHSEVKEADADLDGAGVFVKLKRQVARGLESRGPVDYLKDGLDRSGLAIEWSEFSFYHLLGAALAGAIAFIVSGWPAAMIVIFLGAWSPILILGYLIGKRQALFAAQLPDTLTMLAGSLKAGYSLAQAIDMVSRETVPPMADEFKRVVADSRLGLPIEEALDKMSVRLDNTNFEWMVLAVKIQREVGGNLVEVLSTLAQTIRERETVARQIKVLTAEGRLSAIILLILPVFVAVSLYIINPDYMGLLLNNVAGLAMLTFAGVMMTIGAFWLRRVVKIEV